MNCFRFQVITEHSREITWLWGSLFLSFCANEVTLTNRTVCSVERKWEETDLCGNSCLFIVIHDMCYIMLLYVYRHLSTHCSIICWLAVTSLRCKLQWASCWQVRLAWQTDWRLLVSTASSAQCVCRVLCVCLLCPVCVLLVVLCPTLLDSNRSQVLFFFLVLLFLTPRTMYWSHTSLCTALYCCLLLTFRLQLFSSGRKHVTSCWRSQSKSGRTDHHSLHLSVGLGDVSLWTVSPSGGVDFYGTGALWPLSCRN